MALVAVCKNGREVIGDNLVRGYYTNKNSLILDGDYFNNSYSSNKDKYTDWVYPYYNPDEGVEDVAVVLPNGTIEKIIGHKMSWEDEPIELK